MYDAKVFFPGKARYANLLAASDGNPVQVVGCLEEVEEDQESLGELLFRYAVDEYMLTEPVLDPNYTSKRIVIDNVTHFSYGQHEDGEMGIWVAGRAGWFSISPARGYKPVFNDIVGAVDLLYFLIDKHQTAQRRRGRRKRWGPSVEYLCEEVGLERKETWRGMSLT